MLAVDIGNTTIKICRFSPGGEILWRDTHPTAEISFEFVRSFFKASGASRVVIASVVRPVNVFFKKGLTEIGAQAVYIIDPARDCIIENRLATPQTTGTDRLLSAFAAHAFFPEENLVVMQAGTALTVDGVSAQGVFQGGYILPGPQMWLDSLTSAAQLPYFPPEDMDWRQTAPGDSTRTAILHGAVNGLAGAAREAATAHHRAFAGTSRKTDMCQASSVGEGGRAAGLRTIVTGGWGEPLAAALGAEYRADLVLHGLYAYARTRLQWDDATF